MEKRAKSRNLDHRHEYPPKVPKLITLSKINETGDHLLKPTRQSYFDEFSSKKKLSRAT